MTGRPTEGSTVPGNSAGSAAREVEQALTIPPRPEAAAFFDVDNTMVIGASIFHFAKGLAARKYFSTADLRRFLWQQVKFRAGGEGQRQHQQGPRIGAGLRGRQVGGRDRRDRRRTSTTKPSRPGSTPAPGRWPSNTSTPASGSGWSPPPRRSWPGSSPAGCSLTGALGTRAEEQDGAFTGRLLGDLLHGEAKAAAVRELAEREGLDLAQCAAYSDSINDIPMLSLVGRPVAVNPDSALRDEARRRGWEIREFRTGRRAARVGRAGRARGWRRPAPRWWPGWSWNGTAATGSRPRPARSPPAAGQSA